MRPSRVLQANLVAAFEQSLVSMTSRLRHLAETAEEKDTELLDLRETIDFLKKKNSEAQAVIQGALSASEATPKGGSGKGGRTGEAGGRGGGHASLCGRPHPRARPPPL